MSIKIQRVFVTDINGVLPQNTPSNLTYDLIIEATADAGDNGNTYFLNTRGLDFTALVASPAPMLPPPGSSAIVGTDVAAPVSSHWVQPVPGGRFEGVLRFRVTGLSAAVRDHLFQYFIVLKNSGPGTDADGAESEVFTLL